MEQEKLEQLKKVAKAMVAPGKGILAADESTGTIGKRFDNINLENTEANRKAWRELLFTSPDIGKYISGVIMFDETLRQSVEDGKSFVSILNEAGVLPGIKVDQGLKEMDGSPNEKVTKGLEGLPERLKEYAQIGAKFAKWRAVITIDESNNLPTDENIRKGAEILARYAKDCQEAGIVPIVEPEVLMDGRYNINKCGEVTEKILKYLFEELEKAGVEIEGIILKPNMVLSGKESDKASPIAVAKATLDVFKKVLPENLPGVAFLSGGQSEVEATKNLNEMNKEKNLPWELSFSYGRALQQSALSAWAGKKENVTVAQEKFLHRSKMNSLARNGEYNLSMEN